MGTKVVAVELNESEREAAEWEARKLGLTKSHAILQRCQMICSQVHFVLNRLCTTLHAISSILIVLRSNR